MSEFSVKIHLGNAACETVDDALQVLERVAREINDGRLSPTFTDSGMQWQVRDDNGNTVGRIEVAG
jgi:hypothetical protein